MNNVYTSMKLSTTAKAVEPLWGMPSADDAGIVSRPPEGLEKMMLAIVRIPGLFRLEMSKSKTTFMCLLIQQMPCARGQGLR